MRDVLVIDNGTPCNRFQENSHNLLGSDGINPATIRERSILDVSAYPTVHFLQGTVTQIKIEDDNDEEEKEIILVETVENGSDEIHLSESRKLVIATGVQDFLPDNLPGLQECWGKTVIHCPYCHGYEFAHQRTALLQMKTSTVLTMAPILTKFTDDLYVIGRYDCREEASEDCFTPEQIQQFQRHGIIFINNEAISIDHTDGILNTIKLDNGVQLPMDCAYLRPPCQQRVPLDLFLSRTSERHFLNEKGYIQVNVETQETCVPNIYACGDCTDPNRSVSIALAAGTRAAKMLNYELSMEDWSK
jgi:thioredoxin reductase